MQYSDLHQRKIEPDEQVHVWYRENWCGRFKKGKMPTKKEVIHLVSEHNGFYICEVIAAFEGNSGFSFEVKKNNQ